MNINYKINFPLETEQFVALLRDSTLGERRPLADRACMEGMLANSNLVVTAWNAGRLVGVARCMTDFHYACYLSDLAVAKSCQGRGIGKQLLALTHNQLGPRCALILLAAPAANVYYERLGFSSHSRCWVLDRGAALADPKANA